MKEKDIDSVEFEQEFLQSVASHKMTVLMDSGTHRHIRFANPRCCNQWFEIVTWPQYLTIAGDMGEYVFARVDDMFRFFRNRPVERNTKRGKVLSINTDYWAEKLQAVDIRGDVKEFCPDTFRARVNEYVNDFIEGESEEVDGETIPWDKADELREEIEEFVDSVDSDCDERAAHEKLFEFSSDLMPDGFTDTFEWTISKYTYRFGWCLHAIVWGIDQYDKSKAVAASPDLADVAVAL